MSSRFARVVAATAVFNVVGAVLAGVAGVLIARSVGPEIRGEYAAVTAWFGVVAVVAQLGQQSAVTYYVAHDRRRGPDVVSTSRSMMLGAAVVVYAVGWVVAPLVAGGDQGVTVAYRVAFLALGTAALATAYVMALQAVDIPVWNLVRFCQPAAYLVGVVVLQVSGRLGLLSAMWTMVGTFAVQAVLAYVVARSRGLAGGRSRRGLVPPLVGYGVEQLVAAGPVYLALRLDQLMLSVMVAAAVLGHYAVAASVTGIAIPFVAALGHVAFPRVAAGDLSRVQVARLQAGAVRASLAVGAVIMGSLAVGAHWLIPLVFGPAYADAVRLVWWLCPGGVFLASGQVVGDLLRGQRRPLAVARGNAIAVVVLGGLLLALVPRFGAVGAAVASTVAAAVGLGALLRELHRTQPTPVEAYLVDARGTT